MKKCNKIHTWYIWGEYCINGKKCWDWVGNGDIT